jgi:hypothetical protein
MRVDGSVDGNMTQNPLQVTINDVQAAMQGDERVALKVQLTAAMRRITELEQELAEAANSPNGIEKARMPEEAQLAGKKG